MSYRSILAVLLVVVILLVFPVVGLSKGKGKLNAARTVTFHEPVGQTGREYVDIGLNVSFSVDHEAVVLCHGVMDAGNTDDGKLDVAVFVDGQEDPDPMTWRTNGAPKSFLRAVTVPAGQHTISVRIRANQDGGQPGVFAGERRLVVQVF